MATITAITSSGTPLNVLATSTWVGGVVPGAADTAVFPNQTVRTQFTSDVNLGYRAQTPWTGRVSLNVTSTTGFPTSGSIYIFPAPIRDALLPVKIDYTGSTATSFLSCSVDYTFRNWIYQNSHSYTETFPGDNIAMGDLQYNDYVYRGFTGSIASSNAFNWQNQYILTGSSTWEVGKINMGHGCDFTVKDTATLLLNNTTTTSTCFLNPTSAPAYGGVRLLDSCTLRVTGSYDNRNVDARVGLNMTTISHTYTIISGSSNYSSSMLASASAAGTSTLTLQDATAFGIGDFITVQSVPNTSRYGYVKSGSSTIGASGSLSKYGSPNADQSFPIGGYYGPMYATYDTASHETDDIVQIENISGNTVTVAKRFGKQGEIQQDLGLYDFRSFTETYLSSPAPYTGTMRAVLVDSNHRSYAAGETIIISGSAYRVHHVTTYLSQSAFIDFTNPTTQWKDYIALDEYMYSGSGYTMTGTFNPSYRKWALLTTASRAGVSSLYIDSASCSTPSSPSTSEASIFAPLKNTYFTEGEITLSGSILRNFTTLDALQSALGVFCGVNPYHRTYTTFTNASTISVGANLIDGASGLAVHDTTAFVRHLGLTYGNSIWWNQSGSFDPNQNYADLPITPFTGSGQSVNLKITRENGIQRYYLQNVLLDEALLPTVERGMVSIALQRFASIYTVNIKERYQLLLLDTQQTFLPRDFIKEGGLLDTQQSGKICKFVANEIEDPMGMRNIAWDYYYKKGKTNILPYCHNFIQSVSGNIDTGILNTATFSRNLAFRTQGTSAWTPSTIAKTSTNFFITYDLGQAVNFDTVGVGVHNLTTSAYGESDTNNRLLGVQIDVADNPNNWTTVWSKADDNRLSTGGNAVRFYSFPSGSVTKRFIRFYSDGGSANINYNNQTFFGVYNFATGSGGAYPGNTTNQIKLRSAQNFAVGDQIYFWNKDAGGKISDGALFQGGSSYVRFINYDSITNIATTATDADTVGGLTDYYTITAKSGSVITLDRTPAYDHLLERTVVMKVNRGKLNVTGGRLNRVIISQAGSNSTIHVEHMQHYNCMNGTVTGLFRSIDPTYSPIRGVLEDSFLYSPQRNRQTHNQVGMRERNIIGRVSNFGPGVLDSYYSAYTGIAFNNFMTGQNSTLLYLHTDHADKQIFNHNVLLLNQSYFQTRYANASQGPFERRCKIFIKNNHFNQMTAVDPRTIAPNTMYTYNLDQTYKLTEWKNNTFSGILAATVQAAGGVTNYPVSQLWRLTDSRINGFAPLEPKYASVILSYNGVPYVNNARNDIDHRGYLETLPIRTDKSTHIRLNSKLTTHILLFNETDYYSAWQSTTAASTVMDQGNFLNCSFYVNTTSSVKIQLNLRARVPVGRKHAAGDAPSAARISQGFQYPNRVIPKILITNIDTHTVLSRTLVDDINWKTISIDETFTLTPGHYSITFETGFDVASSSGGGRHQHIIDYTRPELSVLTTNLSNIVVYHNNWDIHKLFDNAEFNLVTDPIVSTNRGVNSVERVVNNVATSVKFNKVKL